MNKGPYQTRYLPVSRASDALRNQADTMLSELHGSIDRAKAFREKLAQRAAEKARDQALARLTWVVEGSQRAVFGGQAFYR